MNSSNARNAENKLPKLEEGSNSGSSPAIEWIRDSRSRKRINSQALHMILEALLLIIVFYYTFKSENK